VRKRIFSYYKRPAPKETCSDREGENRKGKCRGSITVIPERGMLVLRSNSAIQCPFAKAVSWSTLVSIRGSTERGTQGSRDAESFRAFYIQDRRSNAQHIPLGEENAVKLVPVKEGKGGCLLFFKRNYSSYFLKPFLGGKDGDGGGRLLKKRNKKKREMSKRLRPYTIVHHQRGLTPLGEEGRIWNKLRLHLCLIRQREKGLCRFREEKECPSSLLSALSPSEEGIDLVNG